MSTVRTEQLKLDPGTRARRGWGPPAWDCAYHGRGDLNGSQCRGRVPGGEAPCRRLRRGRWSRWAWRERTNGRGRSMEPS